MGIIRPRSEALRQQAYNIAVTSCSPPAVVLESVSDAYGTERWKALALEAIQHVAELEDIVKEMEWARRHIVMQQAFDRALYEVNAEYGETFKKLADEGR